MEAFSIYCLILTSFFPHQSIAIKTAHPENLPSVQWQGLASLRQSIPGTCSSCKGCLLVVQKSTTIQFPRCGSLSSWTHCCFPGISRTSGGKFFSDPVQVLELWSLCGLKCIVPFCPSVFQLLWHPSCCQLRRASAFPV